MNFRDCIDFVLKNPHGFTATAEGDQPHVRPLTVWRADGTGIYFFLPKFKQVYRQLLENSKVEIAFHQPGTPQDLGTLLRVTGRFEFLEDADTRKRLFEIQPWLKQLGDGTDNPMVAIFRISQGEFSFWTWENNPPSNPAPKISFP